jgi:DNA-binding Xre family transcriptional regulator
MIYPNLDAEMARQRVMQMQLADEVGITRSTMSLKLNGKAPISLDEAFSIKKALHSRLSLDVLFDKAEV